MIRRLSLDLLGLPPSVAEVDAFVSDASPEAYEHLVDRLLVSPHYGERWGRHWLDLARYADSDGYEKDTPRPFAWRYRNWVIDALNRDLPFDQFTIEQLAGDLLPGATTEQKVATGFHRNTLTNTEGGTDPEEFRVLAVVDRVNTTGTVWMGLTVGCAQCHTHKYDPIKHKEYYGLFAFFNSDREDNIPAPLADEALAYETAKTRYEAEHRVLIEALASYENGPRAAASESWIKEREAKPLPRWSVLPAKSFSSRSGATMIVQPEGSILVAGPNPDRDSYALHYESGAHAINGLRLEVLPDPSLGASGPGRTPHGNFVLTGLKVEARVKGGESRVIKIKKAEADYRQPQFDVDAAIDGDSTTGWAVGGALGQPHIARFELAEPIPPESSVTLTLDQNYGSQHTIGRFRISAIAHPDPLSNQIPPDDIADALAIPSPQRTPEQTAKLATFARGFDPEWQRLADTVKALETKTPKPPATKAQTLALMVTPRKTNIHIRGDFQRKGDEVAPHTLAVLPPLEKPNPSRLDLARWLVNPEHPLMSRVAVNRIWRHLFGRGIVASVDDFGTRGELPSHPELLDWLAVEFPSRKWSQKDLIRLIVNSSTYRQSSNHRSDLLERDPNNVLLARQSRFRPEAEVVRDLALASSGLLATTIGGPSVRPPQPPGIAELTYAGSARWVPSEGADRYRRGMYTFFQRTSPYPMLITFDAPDSNVCAVKRERSNTPLQALAMLNDATFVECAQALAKRVAEQLPGGSAEDRLKLAIKTCLGRDASLIEKAMLTNLFTTCKAEFTDHPEAAKKFVDANGGSADLAAWVVVSRAILNLDEFVTRE